MSIGPSPVFDGNQNVSPRGGRNSEVMVSQYAPPYYEAVRTDRVFVYTILSQAIILSATTGGHPTILNPSSSGRNFVPLALRIAWISTAFTAGAFAWALTRNSGNGAATAAPVLTATLVAQINARMGVNLNNNSKMLWSPTTNTFTAAPTVVAATGLGTVVTATDTALNVSYNGEFYMEPGNALSLVYTVTTATSLVSTTIWGYEPDV